MFERFTDKINLSNNRDEFVKRKYGFPLIFLFLGFLVTLTLISVAEVIFDESHISIIVVTFAALTLLFIFTSIYLHRSEDIIMATELQNSMFARAMKASNDACVIIKKNGSLIYYDDNFRKLSPVFNNRKKNFLEVIQESEALDEESLKTFLEAIEKGEKGKVDYQIVGKGGEYLTMSFEPLQIKERAKHFENEYNTEIKRKFSTKLAEAKKTKEYFYIRWYKEPSTHDFMDKSEVAICAVNIREKKISFVNKRFQQLFSDYKEHEHDIINKLELDNNYIIKHYYIPQKSNKQYIFNKAFDHKIFAKDEMFFFVEESNPLVCDDDYKWLNKEKSPVPKILADEKGNLVMVNKSFLDFIGEKNIDVTKISLFNIIKEDNRPDVKELFDRVASLTQEEDTKHVNINVKFGDVDKSCLIFINKFSKNRFICHFLDRTEHKDLEIKFAHSQKMQAIGQLAGGIAHDFNNLLTAMIGFCDLLLIKHPAGDQSFADIMQIKQNANRAANLVRQLLAFSRKQTLQPTILDITAIISELSNLIRRLIGENIELKLLHGRDIQYVKVDQGQLEQVIINLAVNARDAMPSGGALTISTSNVKVDEYFKIDSDLFTPDEDDNIQIGDYILIEIIDTGYGMSRETMKKIFEPFFSTKAPAAGTGLGLSTVYGIVKQTGGYIYVRSKPELGTNFYIYLRSYDKHDQTEEQKDNNKEQITSENNLISDLTGSGVILLVEDEAAVRAFGAQALKNKGYTVLEAENGEQALKFVEKNEGKIDIIVTDVMMPGMTGPDMIEKVMENYPDIRVIFISGYAEDAFVKTYGNERKFNFLAKPFTLKQLAAKVKEILEG